MAERALREGRLLEAERLSRLALLENPSRLRPRLIIGRVRFARWMASAAASQFAAAAGNDPELRSLLLLVAAERRRENLEAALAWARRAVEKAPEDLTAIL